MYKKESRGVAVNRNAPPEKDAVSFPIFIVGAWVRLSLVVQARLYLAGAGQQPAEIAEKLTIIS